MDLPETKAADYFAEDGSILVEENDGVKWGEMMSSVSIKYKGRNIAFFLEKEDKPVFRLGKEFDAEKFGLSECEVLHLSKEKPPMEDWFIVTEKDEGKWGELLEMALDLMIEEFN